MIRVLHVIGAMGSGGAEAMIMNIYRNINREKLQFDFVVHTSEECFYDKEIEQLGGKIFRIEKFDGSNFFKYKKFWDRFFLEHEEYKIVHGHINSSAAIYLTCARKHDRITVVHSHATRNIEKNIRAYAFLIFSYPIRFIADYFFACSRQAGIDRFGENTVDKKNFSVLNNGIDKEKYLFNIATRERIREQFHLEENCLVVGHVGRFTVAKNHLFLLKVFAELNKKEDNIELWLIGTGELEQQIKDKVLQYGMQNKVRFLGVTNRVYDYLQAMDVFCFPSVFEGLGIALIEAQASGLPCVVSENIQEEADIGADLVMKLSLNETIDNWVNAVLKMKDIKRRDTGEELERSNYDIKTIAAKLEKFYINLQENKNGKVYY